MANIVVVAQGLGGGGAERVASILTNYLFEAGHKVTLVAAYNDKKGYELHDEITIVSIKTDAKTSFLRLINRNWEIYRAIKASKGETVYSFITNELLLTQIMGVPVIHSLRNHPDYIDNNFVARNLRRVAYHLAKKIVFQTEEAMKYFPEKIRKKSVVIPNPISVSALPQWSSYPQHYKTFVAASRLHSQKNLPMLIQGFKIFHDCHPGFSLEIYGDGEEYGSLFRLIQELGAQTYIYLKGHTSEIHDIMAKSYCFVSTSNFEGLSNSMLEALTIGMPCICTDCPPGGARAFIKDHYNGRLVNVGDVNMLSEAFLELAKDEKLAWTFSQNTFEIRKRLDAEVVCSRWESILKD